MRVVAVSVDPPETSREHAAKQGYTFPILADPKMEVIQRYDLAHGKIARPAEFLIDPQGIVRWRDLTEDFTKRITADRVLAALDELGVKPRAGK